MSNVHAYDHNNRPTATTIGPTTVDYLCKHYTIVKSKRNHTIYNFHVQDYL